MVYDGKEMVIWGYNREGELIIIETTWKRHACTYDSQNSSINRRDRNEFSSLAEELLAIYSC